MALDAAGYRNLVGHFATGVTVLTTAVGTRLHGMTANALTSVSLDPMLLLVCIDESAHAHAELLEGGRFAVNILGAEQEELSRLFAASNEPEEGRLGGAEYHLGPNGQPILDGCLAYMECRVADRFVSGDHTVFIGEVLGGETHGDTPPLLFYRGGYHRIENVD